MINYTDEELVVLAKHNKKYLEALILRYRLFVSHLTCNYELPSYNAEDFFQEGLIALCKAVKSFEVSKQIRFSTYATACIKNRIKDIFKAESTKNSQGKTISLDYKMEEEADYYSFIASDVLSPEEKLLDEENKAEKKKMLKESLSRLEYNVLMLRIEGLSYEEIVNELQKKTDRTITYKMVDNALQRAKQKLESQRTDIE